MASATSWPCSRWPRPKSALKTRAPPCRPPRYCSKRRSTKPRWISSRTPPAIITTNAKITASHRLLHQVLQRVVRHVAQPRRHQLHHHQHRDDDRRRTRGSGRGRTCTSRAFGRQPNSCSRTDSPCARMKNTTSPTSRSVSSSVSVNTNGGDSPPSASRIFMPNALQDDDDDDLGGEAGAEDDFERRRRPLDGKHRRWMHHRRSPGVIGRRLDSGTRSSRATSVYSLDRRA